MKVYRNHYEGGVTSERFAAFAPSFGFIPTFIPMRNPAAGPNSVASVTHPLYDAQLQNWKKWRAVYEGGDSFVESYTEKFSQREDPNDFRDRKKVTPTPSFASSAVDEIKNAIFQRLNDVSRKGGSDSYTQSVEGGLGGIDLQGSRMNWFIGHYILPELLVMKKVGVYVDKFQQFPTDTLATIGSKHPYYYMYRAEDIRTWTKGTYGDKSEFCAVLLRDYTYIYDQILNVPIGEVEVFRFIWIADDKKVHVQFFDNAGTPLDEEKILDIDRIPFAVAEISESVLKHVANHQIALLNLESSDISFVLKGNLALYVEQYDSKNTSTALKSAQQAFNNTIGSDGITPVVVMDEDGIPVSTLATSAELARRNRESSDEVIAGPTQGRRYPDGLNAPAFIAPPTGPLESSMKKQEALKTDIRMLVHLAVTNTKSMGVSAESKSYDQQGLESGLSNIGLELENLENKLASFWFMYEKTGSQAVVHYPEQYSLMSPDEIQKKIKQMTETRDELPSKTFKAEVNKDIAKLLLRCQVSDETLRKIYAEIDNADFYTSNPKQIVADTEAGLVDINTASLARGYPKGTADLAKADHAERIARIQAAQVGKEATHVAEKAGEDAMTSPAARGIPDLSGNPAQDATLEKVGKAGRGEGK